MFPPISPQAARALQVLSSPRSSKSDRAIVLADLYDMLHLVSSVEITEQGCWLWKRAVDDSGYGVTTVCGTTVRAHRLAWSFEHGRVPDRDKEIDHLCAAWSEKRCCAPDHLEEVTHQENVRRAYERRRPAQTCRQGHPYDDARPRVNNRGDRVCRPCDSAAQRRYRNKKRRA